MKQLVDELNVDNGDGWSNQVDELKWIDDL